MLRPVLNKYCKQHPIKLQLYSHLPLISQSTQERLANIYGTTSEVRMNTLATVPNGFRHVNTQVLTD